jgi:hypothetical protein
MKPIKDFVYFYVHASIHVAICFVALFMALHFSNIEIINWQVLLLLFCGALLGYNLIKYTELIIRRHSIIHKKGIIAISIFCAVVIELLLVEEHGIGIGILASAFVISVLYALPFWEGKGLRSIPVLKLTSVAVSWSLVTVVYPQYSVFTEIIQEEAMSNTALFVKALAVAVLVVALCIPFEIRDIKYDSPELHTLPQLIGVRNTKLFGITMAALFFALSFYSTQLSKEGNIFILLSVAILLGLLIWFTDRFKGDHYASILVEAVPLFWLGMLWINSLFQ